jgi:hypothetical protein
VSGCQLPKSSHRQLDPPHERRVRVPERALIGQVDVGSRRAVVFQVAALDRSAKDRRDLEVHEVWKMDLGAQRPCLFAVFILVDERHTEKDAPSASAKHERRGVLDVAKLDPLGLRLPESVAQQSPPRLMTAHAEQPSRRAPSAT